MIHPVDEDGRLRAVRRYRVLDTPPDGAFDRITALAARHFGVPISIVSIVDTDRIWFKSHHGVEVAQVSREPGLCASAILQDEPWVVENAAIDPRTLANPLVAGELGLRFYAGIPLKTADGYNLGTLCIIDKEPRSMSVQETSTLSDMAAIVMDELELRLNARSVIEQERQLREQAESLARELQARLLPPQLPDLDGIETAALYLPADAAVVGGDFYDLFAMRDSVFLAVGDVSGKGSAAAAVTGMARHTIRSAALLADSPAGILATLNEAMLFGRAGIEIEHFCTVLLGRAQAADGGLLLTLSSAGHPPAMLVRADGTADELHRASSPAGCYPDASFEEQNVLLEPGDRLLLFTDGLIDTRTEDGVLEVDGVKRWVARAGSSAQDLVDALRYGLSEPGVQVHDDVAALALKVL